MDYKSIIEVIEPTFKSRLDFFTPEFAKTIQYVGFDVISESRVSLKFKSSLYGVYFSLDSQLFGNTSCKLYMKYNEIYSHFREIKYEYLNEKKRY